MTRHDGGDRADCSAAVPDFRHRPARDQRDRIATPITREADGLALLKDVIEQGHLRAVIDRRYPLDDIVDAHRYVDQGHKKGSVAVTVP